MNIKIGNFDLKEWYYNDDYNSWIRDDAECKDIYLNCIEVFSPTFVGELGPWHFSFYGKLKFLSKLYSGPRYSNSADNTKEIVDNFLIRIAPLMALA